MPEIYATKEERIRRAAQEKKRKEMIELNKQAKEKNMSYGQYVAYLEQQKEIDARKRRKEGWI